jgi:hypothetical protein
MVRGNRGYKPVSLRARLGKLEGALPSSDPLAEANRAFLTRWLATRDEAAGLLLDYEEQLEAAGSQLTMYQRDEGRAVILAMVESLFPMI